MKKFFKALALVLALALVIGVVPAQATSAKIKAKKTLYVDGAKGESTDGKKTSSYKERVAIYKLAGAKKADKEDHKFTAKIKSGDSVTVSKNYVYAAGLGKSVVELFKDGESLGTSVITVKKNATADTLTITEFEDGKEVVCGVEYTVTLPRKGVDSDERRLFVDDKAVADKEDAPRAYAVKFTKAGDHKVKFEAFQSAELDKATASKEITVKAVMPKPVSAKQVSASSFAVEFEGNMEGLISKDDITNQMIYYLLVNEHVVTGAIKAVEVKDKVVTVTMYSNFNNDTDYYFEYGSADPVKFHTAKNDIKYATSIKLIEEKAYYVGQENKVTYKFYNADGVELDITDQVATLSYDSEVAYLMGPNNSQIYFFKEGPATIKASIVTGYDEETNDPIKLEDSLTVNGVTKTANQTGKVYSFGAYDADIDPAKEIHSIRLNDAKAAELSVKYKLSDGNDITIKTDSLNTDGYYLKSADETIAMIKDQTKTASTIVGVQKGTTYIILCDAEGKEKDAFQITVLEENRVSEANVYFTQDTLNLCDLVAAGYGRQDTLDLIIDCKDLNGEANKNYKYKVEQAKNNAEAVGIEFLSAIGVATAAGDAKTKIALTKADFKDNRALTSQTGVAVVRFVVTVTNTVDGATVATKNISLAVSNQDTADSWSLRASETALDASIKNWDKTDLDKAVSKITAAAVKKASGYTFFINDEEFTVISSVSQIPATGTAIVDDANYVLKSYRSDATTVTYPDAKTIQIAAFEDQYTQGKTGTYSFTGYHVAYDANDKGIRTPMGTANVVLSINDVAASVSVLLGTVEEYNANPLYKVFKVTWDGIESKNDNSGRVRITGVDAKDDDVTGAIFVYTIEVAFDVNTTGTIYTFTKDVPVNKLFKDKEK